MALRRTTGERAFDAANVVFLAVLACTSIYPFFYVLFASVSDPLELMSHRGFLFGPAGFQVNAYRLVFANPILLSSYANTILYVAAGTVISLFLTTLGAYALSRIGPMWGNLIMFLVVFSMWFNGGLIPFFLLVRDLGMLNSRLSQIIPRAVITYNLIVMRTMFMSVPVSLEESARMDGARDFSILFRIVVPLSLPVIAVVTMFYAVRQWNAWFDAMIFLNDRNLYPLQIVLREILILNSTDSIMAGSTAQSDQIPIGETIKYATVIVATAPILAVYPFLQKYFVKGMMVGAIKG